MDSLEMASVKALSSISTSQMEAEQVWIGHPAKTTLTLLVLSCQPLYLTAIQSAVADTTRQLTRDFESDKALMQARFDGEKNVLVGKIEALEKMAASQEAQIKDLSKKSEQAYEKVQDIANKAVSASRREVYNPQLSRSGAAVRDEDQG